MMEPDLCLQNGVLHRFPVIALEDMNPHHRPRPPGPGVGGQVLVINGMLHSINGVLDVIRC